MKTLKLAANYANANGKTYPFPSEDISSDQRGGNDYYLAVCNAIMSRLVNNCCAVPYQREPINGYRSFAELRAYRNGTNSPDKYKNWMAFKDEKTGQRKSTVNISYGVNKFLVQKIDAVKGHLQKIRYDVDTTAVDYEAKIAKKTMVAMAKLMADPRTAALRGSINQAAGREAIPQPSPEQMPGGMQFSDPKEVDMASQIGAFYLDQEAAIQNLCNETKRQSSIDALIDMWDEDLLTCGLSGSFVYTNPNTSMVTVDYLDIDECAIPYSMFPDYRDITWAGARRRMTIAQLRKETNATEEELIKIAISYSGSGNVHSESGFYSNLQNYRNNSGFGMNMIDQIEVDILECRWYGKKNVNYTSIFREKDSRTAINEVDDKYTLTDKDAKKGKNLYKYSGQTIYKAKLVVGTSMVFDTGEDTDLVYKTDINGNRWPVFPMRFYRCLSLVDRCVEYVDDVNMANYKLRIARTKMPAPPGLVIDKSFFENVSIDGVTMKPMQLMKLAQDEGFVIGDSKNMWGQSNSAGKPVSTMPTDMIQVLQAWREDIAHSMMMVEKVTGINDVFAAQAPQREQGLGVSNLLVQGTQNSLTPIITARKYLFESVMQVTGYKWQIVGTYMPDDMKQRLSISRSLDIVKIGSDLLNYDFEITVQASMTDDEKQQLLADITKMRAAARQMGQGGISEADYLVVFGMIKAGNVIQAQLYLAHAIEKRKKEAQQEQQQAIQSNGQQQMQSAQQAAQNEQQTLQMESQLSQGNEQAKLMAEYKMKSQLQKEASQQRINELAIQNIYGQKQSA